MAKCPSDAQLKLALKFISYGWFIPSEVLSSRYHFSKYLDYITTHAAERLFFYKKRPSIKKTKNEK